MVTSKPETELAQGTPDPDKIDLETGKRTTKEVPGDVVGDYPARPYGQAITDEHRAFLAEAGIQVADE